MKLLPILSSLFLVLPLAPAAIAHGGLFRSPGGPIPLPPPPTTAPPTSGGVPPTSLAAREAQPNPGSAPTLAFADDRWEFWWEFNQDGWLNLRPSLLQAASKPGATPFHAYDSAGKTQELLPILVTLLRDKDEQVRSATLFALARLQDPSTIPYISSLLIDDPSLQVRTNAVIALGLTRVPRAVERLRLVFNDEHAQEEVRAFAAVALGVNACPEASSVLREALTASGESKLSPPVKLAVAYALGLSEDPANAPFLRSLATAKYEDETLRALVIQSLGRVGDRAANSILLEALASTKAQVRRSAAIALGAVARPDDSDVVKALDKIADNDPDGIVRQFAEISLGRIASLGAPALVERLRARLKSAPVRQRGFIALALGISGYEAAASDLLAMFKQEANASLRGAAAVGLALLDHKAAIPELRAAFRQGGEPMLRAYVAFALGKLGDQEIVKELHAALARENEPQVLYWSAVAAGLLGDRTVTSELEQIESKSGEQVTKASCILGLGRVGDRDATKFLSEVAHDLKQTDVVRAFAAYSLGLLCDEDRAPLTAAFSRDHNYTLNVSFLPELYYLF